MTFRIIPQSEWGGAQPTMPDNYIVAPSARKEYIIHFDGGVAVTATGYAIPKAIQHYHMTDPSRMYVDGGYNWVIESSPGLPTDGAIYEMRGLNYQGAQCVGHNISGVGVQIAIGADEQPSQKALESVVALYDYCVSKCGHSLVKAGHLTYNATDCPGKHLTFFFQNDFNIAKTISAGHALAAVTLPAPPPPVVIPGPDPAAFIKRVVPLAQGVQRKYSVPASVCIAQTIQETAYGTAELALKAKNFFGIKATSVPSPLQTGSYSKATKEYYDSSGIPSTVVDAFRTYASMEDSFLDYGAKLFENSRYWGAFRYQTSPDQFAKEVHAAGYATDPSYSDNLIDIMKRYDLHQYNVVTVVPEVQAPVPEPTPVPEPGTTVQPPADDGQDRHVPSAPFSTTLTLQKLQWVATHENLSGTDYEERLQALWSLRDIGVISGDIFPPQGIRWDVFFRECWAKWQVQLGASGTGADGVPGAGSVKALVAKQPQLTYVDESVPATDGQDRHEPTLVNGVYSDTLTVERLVRAAQQDVLTGPDYDHRYQAMASLHALGHANRVTPPEGTKWSEWFRVAWKKWQLSSPDTAVAADGIPGKLSVWKLTRRVVLDYWSEADNSNTYGVPTSSALTNPTQGGRITTAFGLSNASNWPTFGRHTGSDYAASITSGSAIYAVSSGTVTYKWSSVLGNIAILKANDLAGKTYQYFWYCHLAVKPTTGTVTKGQKIGTMGMTGSGAKGVHLHIELQKSGTTWGPSWSDFTDPAPFLKQG